MFWIDTILEFGDLKTEEQGQGKRPLEAHSLKSLAPKKSSNKTFNRIRTLNRKLWVEVSLIQEAAVLLTSLCLHYWIGATSCFGLYWQNSICVCTKWQHRGAFAPLQPLNHSKPYEPEKLQSLLWSGNLSWNYINKNCHSVSFTIFDDSSAIQNSDRVK